MESISNEPEIQDPQPSTSGQASKSRDPELESASTAYSTHIRFCDLSQTDAYKTAFRALVLTGPPCSGKTCLIDRFIDDFPRQIGFCTSHTTRKPKKGEIDGQHFHFVSKESMMKYIDKGKMLEITTIGEEMYGTSRRAVERVLEENMVCVLEYTVDQVKQARSANFDAWYIFVMPPSLTDLKSRMPIHPNETKQQYGLRLMKAMEDMDHGKDGDFDLVLINQDLDETYETLRNFMLEKVGVVYNPDP